MNRLRKGTLNRLFRALACVMILIFTFDAGNIMVSAEVTEDSIKAKEAQISKQKEERDSLKNAKTFISNISNNIIPKRTVFFGNIDGQNKKMYKK